jgi:hypothetical protein
MTDFTLDITGKVCPYCILAVQKEGGKMKKGDRLTILCDHSTVRERLGSRDRDEEAGSRPVEDTAHEELMQGTCIGQQGNATVASKD